MCDPLIYAIDHPKLIVSIIIQRFRSALCWQSHPYLQGYHGYLSNWSHLPSHYNHSLGHIAAGWEYTSGHEGT